MMSFTQRSRVSSSGSIPKIDTTETAKDKEIYHMTTKADPTRALNEAQPGRFLIRIRRSALLIYGSDSQCH